MALNYSIYDAPGGSLIADYSPRVRDLVFATNEHGFAECHGFVPMSLPEAFRLYDRPGTPHAVISENGAILHEGRVEDIKIGGGGITIASLGYSRAMTDAPYTALWSKSGVIDFRPFRDTDSAGCVPDRFTFDNNNRVYISPQKNATLGNTTSKFAMMGWQAPDLNTRGITGVSFDFVFTVPVINWRAAFQTRDASFVGIANPWLITSTGGGTLTGSVFATFASAQIVNFFMDYNAADAVFGGENGSAFLRITNLRLVTSTVNKVDTTFTANRAAGVNVTATVGSTARMYVGQSLVINSGGAVSESVTVLSIGSSTQFNATFANAYVIGNTVQAHVVYGDEIAKDLVSTINTLNSAQLASSTALIQSPAVDLLNETYQDQYPNAILDYLIKLGDNQTPPREWEWGIYESRFLYFRPESTANKTWYVDISELELERTINTLFNSVYANYQDSSGRTLRTAASADAYSPVRFALTRRESVAADTTSSTQAGIIRAAELTDKATPIPRINITIDSIYDANGGRYPLHLIRTGDTVIIRNLPANLSSSIDRIRIFRVTRTEYDVMNDTIILEPESPMPTLDALIARQAIGH